MRYYYAREALSDDTGEDRERSSVESFQKSLPIIPTRRLVVLVVTSWAALSFLIAYALSLSAPLAGLNAPRIVQRSVSALALATQTTVSNLNLAGGLPILFQQVMTDWYTALSFVTLLVASLYVLLLAPTNAYRFKRIMFNSRAKGGNELANIVALRHRSRREGVYSLEAQLFHALGLTQSREIQWDLFVPLLPFVFMILIVSINMPSLSSESQMSGWAYASLAFLSALLLARLGFLLVIGRRRQRRSLTPSSTSRLCPNCGYWIPVQETICNFCSYSFAMNQCVRTNPSAIASVVCGLVGILFGFPAAISGLFLGLTAQRQIRESGRLQQGLILANVGVIVSLIALVLTIVAFLLAVVSPS
jgi:hypothetical protein